MSSFQVKSLSLSLPAHHVSTLTRRTYRAVRATPRHLCVPRSQLKYAWYDMALPIGSGQTLSPPFVVANMTQGGSTGEISFDGVEITVVKKESEPSSTP